MLRFLLSLLVTLVIGAGIGLYLGWVQFPLQSVDRPASALSSIYRDEYVVLVAAGYTRDQDLNGVLDRLRVLRVENAPQLVQEVTERYITSSRDITEIRYLVTLSESLGRLTPIMQPYRNVSVPGGGS